MSQLERVDDNDDDDNDNAWCRRKEQRKERRKEGRNERTNKRQQGGVNRNVGMGYTRW